jgi:hypothetical protein
MGPELQFFVKQVFPVTLAKGPHPFPFRTRQLSPSAPMVLRGRLRGRVGRRRGIHFEGSGLVPELFCLWVSRVNRPRPDTAFWTGYEPEEVPAMTGKKTLVRQGFGGLMFRGSWYWIGE